MTRPVTQIDVQRRHGWSLKPVSTPCQNPDSKLIEYNS
jgi:hypothetical protein